jgi:hypothetical protein
MRNLERHVFHGPLFADRVLEEALTLSLAKDLLQLANFYRVMMIVLRCRIEHKIFQSMARSEDAFAVAAD